MAEMAFDLDVLKKTMLRKYPAFGSTISSVKYQIVGNNHPVKTAATDGKTIYVNADFMANLPEDEQVFVMSHEVCHIALNHIQRSKDKDQRLWNIATDGVINQHLKKDGLTLPEGCVDIEDALEYNAEELYEKLLAEKQQQKQQQQQQGQNQQGQQEQQGEEQQQQQGQGSGQEQEQNENSQGGGQGSEQEQEQGQGEQEQEQNENSQGGGQGSGQEQEQQNKEQGQGEGEEQGDTQVGHDDHSMWKEAVAQEEEEKKKGKGSSKQTDEQDSQEEQEVSEKDAFEKNEEERIKRAEEVMRKISSARCGLGGNTQEVNFDDIGKASKPVTNWKRMLVRTLEIEDEAWGHKFSDRASGYAARIEDEEYDEKAETEIILDTSGSISIGLLKNFLRQVKTVLKDSTIKVGTFSDRFHGFVEIKRESDIDNLRIRVGGGTNFDAASRAFTKRKDVNKICFTDGEDGGDAEIKHKRKDILWISFENPDFKPDYGKVLFVPESQINLQRIHDDTELTI